MFRVIDLTRLLPGAFATYLLAEHGAEIIKVEDPGRGDPMRELPALGGTSVYFERLHGGKKSVTLNLRAADAATVLDALLATADVIVDSFRPSTARRLGVDHATLRARHPRLVCCSITGFGDDGPRAELAAHDINYQALAGVLKTPYTGGPLIGDIGASYQAATGILAALLRRDRTGEGAFVDVSIHGAAAMWRLFPSADDLLGACYATYETADGQWLALGALEPKFWAGFCERIGRPEFIADQHARGERGAQIADEVRVILRTRTREEWMQVFADADVCLTPVLDTEEARMPGRLKPASTEAKAPALGADTDDVLEAVGISAARRAELRRAGVI